MGVVVAWLGLGARRVALKPTLLRRPGACRRWALLVEGRTLLAAPYAFTRDLIGTVRGPWGDDLGSRHTD